jgi:SAM-dependent methyltransferase
MTESSGFQVSASAPEHYESRVAPLMAPFVGALVEACVSPGQRVLDVACGTGFATRAASRAAAPNGQVVGSDINPAMLETAQRVADEGSTITWELASALDLPFPDNTFDSVISQQGVQFLPDVVKGLEEMARVTKPGGRLGVTVWAPIEDNPFFDAELSMCVEACGLDRSELLQAFPAGGDRQLSEWLNGAGIVDQTIRLIEAMVDLPSVDEYVPAHLRALPWAGTFFELTATRREEALSSVDRAVAEFKTARGLTVPIRSYLVVAFV